MEYRGKSEKNIINFFLDPVTTCLIKHSEENPCWYAVPVKIEILTGEDIVYSNTEWTGW